MPPGNIDFRGDIFGDRNLPQVFVSFERNLGLKLPLTVEFSFEVRLDASWANLDYNGRLPGRFVTILSANTRNPAILLQSALGQAESEISDKVEPFLLEQFARQGNVTEAQIESSDSDIMLNDVFLENTSVRIQE